MWKSMGSLISVRHVSATSTGAEHESQGCLNHENIRSEITALLQKATMREGALRVAMNDAGIDWLRASKEIEKLVSTNVISRFKDSLGYFYKLRKQKTEVAEEQPTEEQRKEEHVQEDEPEKESDGYHIPLPEIDVQFSFTLGKTTIKETLESIAESAIIAAVKSGAYPEITWHGHRYSHIPITEITRLIGGGPETNQRIIEAMIEKEVIDRVEFLGLVFYHAVSGGGK